MSTRPYDCIPRSPGIAFEPDHTRSLTDAELLRHTLDRTDLTPLETALALRLERAITRKE